MKKYLMCYKIPQSFQLLHLTDVDQFNWVQRQYKHVNDDRTRNPAEFPACSINKASYTYDLPLQLLWLH